MYTPGPSNRLYPSEVDAYFVSTWQVNQQNMALNLGRVATVKQVFQLIVKYILANPLMEMEETHWKKCNLE